MENKIEYIMVKQLTKKENINVGEKPETTQNIEIPDISDSLISALQNIKIENNIPPIDLTKFLSKRPCLAENYISLDNF